jgi:hypothetical protein
MWCTQERWLILLELCPAGWHCEEGTYQDSWFLSNCQVRSKPCMPSSSYISVVEYILRLCKSRPTPARSTIHIKPSHLSACMLVTVASTPVRGSIATVRWLPSLSEQVWINAVLQLPCVNCQVLLLNLLCSISVAMFISTELLRESDREREKGCIDQLNAWELTSFSVTDRDWKGG